MYLGETYHRYIGQNDMDLYSEKKVDLPKPELYVIYTGDRKNRPQKISLKNSFFDGECCVDIEAKVICDSKEGDILDQFITFSKVFDSQRRIYPDDKRKSVLETIRICEDKRVLKEYLKEEEAAAVMFSLADQERAYNIHLKAETKEAREKAMAEGRMQEAIRLYHEELKLSPEQIAEKIAVRFEIPLEEAVNHVNKELGISGQSQVY